MDPGRELRRRRQAAGLSQRELAERAGTSQATIARYESGAKQPSVTTYARLLEHCGAELRVADAPAGRTPADLERAGRHLAEVLTLAEALPYRRPGPLRYPRLPTAA